MTDTEPASSREAQIQVKFRCSTQVIALTSFPNFLHSLLALIIAHSITATRHLYNDGKPTNWNRPICQHCTKKSLLGPVTFSDLEKY